MPLSVPRARSTPSAAALANGGRLPKYLLDVGQRTTGTSASAHFTRSVSLASHMWTTNAGSRDSTSSMSSRILSLACTPRIIPLSRTASAMLSAYPRSMSEMLDMPIPSATSRMAETSSGSNSGDTGLPSITASGDAALSIRHPSRPPSRKSTNAADPALLESPENLAMLPRSSSGGAPRRYLCLSPSGGATSSSRDRPGGAARP